jgi:SAM-dependent methyltransferase
MTDTTGSIRINDLLDGLAAAPHALSLWDGAYKIPWNDPAFSARMLAEHLSQDHDLASRRAGSVAAQAAWLAGLVPGRGGRVLDLGCGPGLYAPHLTRLGHAYLGVDFGPASVAHARRTAAVPGRCQFVLGDVLEADLGGPHALAMMLYGELNVFPPRDALRLLRRARAALAPGGVVAVEFQRADAVREAGGALSWHTAPSGLFSDAPHLCLVRGHWFEAEQTAVQCFHVLDAATGGLRTYRSTTRAYAEGELLALLARAGFDDAELRPDWPEESGSLGLAIARA